MKFIVPICLVPIILSTEMLVYSTTNQHNEKLINHWYCPVKKLFQSLTYKPVKRVVQTYQFPFASFNPNKSSQLLKLNLYPKSIQNIIQNQQLNSLQMYEPPLKHLKNRKFYSNKHAFIRNNQLNKKNQISTYNNSDNFDLQIDSSFIVMYPKSNPLLTNFKEMKPIKDMNGSGNQATFISIYDGPHEKRFIKTKESRIFVPLDFLTNDWTKFDIKDKPLRKKTNNKIRLLSVEPTITTLKSIKKIAPFKLKPFEKEEKIKLKVGKKVKDKEIELNSIDVDYFDDGKANRRKHNGSLSLEQINWK